MGGRRCQRPALFGGSGAADGPAAKFGENTRVKLSYGVKHVLSRTYQNILYIRLQPRRAERTARVCV